MKIVNLCTIFHLLLKVEEPEAKKDRKSESRERYKGPDINRKKDKPEGGKDNKKDRSLDPMDPASYSDIPR